MNTLSTHALRLPTAMPPPLAAVTDPAAFPAAERSEGATQLTAADASVRDAFNRSDVLSARDDKPAASVGYAMLRASVSGLAAGVAGVAGATWGGVRGAFLEAPVLSPEAQRVLRGSASMAGVALGMHLGAAAGPLGVVAGLMGGPVAGAMVGQGLVGALEGAAAAMNGALDQGAYAGKQTYGAVARGMDALAAKLGGHPAPPTSASQVHLSSAP